MKLNINRMQNAIASKKSKKSDSKKFPDVNKDGKVTMKDVLIAKGVISNKKK
jgi:hypothetical protein